MARRESPTLHRVTGALARLGWLSLALLHVRVLAAVGARILDDGLDGASLASLVGLTLALALFVLKAFDAPFLRLRTKRHALVAFLLATALIHHDAIAPALDESAVVEIAALAAGSAGAIAILRRTRWLGGVKASLASTLTPRLHLALLGSIARLARPRPAARLSLIAIAPRAPPAPAR